ncbi:MAG: TolC family protein [Planctomycetia bacterium]|nr:TolC family protein [Planctomycetia bacterium]
MQHSLIRLFFAVLLAWGAFASSAFSQAVPQNIASLEQVALQNHPAIQAHRQRLEALSGKYLQEGLGPNPTLEYFGEEMGNGSAGKHGMAVSQEIVTRGKLTRQQEVVSHEILAEEEALKRVLWKVQTDVRIATYNYIAAERRQAMLEAILKINQNIYETAKIMSSRGEATKLDVLNMEIELQKTESEYVSSQNDSEAAWYALACVVGDAQMARVSLSDPLECEPIVRSREEFDTLLQTTSPEITQARMLVATAQKRLDLEYSRNSSNVTLTGGIFYNTADDVVQGNVGVSLPLRIRDRNQGNIASARSEVLAAQRELERITLDIQNRLAETYRQYASAASNANRYRQRILPQARQALELTQKSYEAGEVTYLALLDAQRTYAEVYLAYIEHLRAYGTQKTILEGKLLTGSLEDSLDGR